MDAKISHIIDRQRRAPTRAALLLCVLLAALWSDAAHQHPESADSGVCYSCHFSPGDGLSAHAAANPFRAPGRVSVAGMHAAPETAWLATLPPPRGPPAHS